MAVVRLPILPPPSAPRCFHRGVGPAREHASGRHESPTREAPRGARRSLRRTKTRADRGARTLLAEGGSRTPRQLLHLPGRKTAGFPRTHTIRPPRFEERKKGPEGARRVPWVTLHRSRALCDRRRLQVLSPFSIDRSAGHAPAITRSFRRQALRSPVTLLISIDGGASRHLRPPSSKSIEPANGARRRTHDGPARASGAPRLDQLHARTFLLGRGAYVAWELLASSGGGGSLAPRTERSSGSPKSADSRRVPFDRTRHRLGPCPRLCRLSRHSALSGLPAFLPAPASAPDPAPAPAPAKSHPKTVRNPDATL